MSDVSTIVADVRARGDAALADWSERLDGVAPARAEPAGDIPVDALLALADRCGAGTSCSAPPTSRPKSFPESPWSGVGPRSSPWASTCPRRLVSTLVMCAVPAQVAGVERVAVVTPPEGAGIVARAAELLGVSEVWAVGGPQAIAALAYGTATIAPVDKIVGPGNAFVSEAKLLVSRDVAVDLPAGPSEVVVLVSEGADMAAAELELAAQGEHGPGAVCRLVEADGDLEGALARWKRSRRSISSSSARMRSGLHPACATPERCSSGAGLRSQPATTRPGRTMSFQPAGGPARSAGSASRRS